MKSFFLKRNTTNMIPVRAPTINEMNLREVIKVKRIMNKRNRIIAVIRNDFMVYTTSFIMDRLCSPGSLLAVSITSINFPVEFMNLSMTSYRTGF